MKNLKINFSLNFVTDNYGIISINEPIGFDTVNFVLEQEEGRSGRDVSYAGGETRFTFTKKRHNVAFDKIQEYFENYGFESLVRLEIEIDGIKTIIGELDFFTADNNQYDEFSCDVVQDSQQALIKRRADIDVDLFSDKTLDNNDIEPCRKYNYLLRSKDIVQRSEWDMGEQSQKYETGDYYRSIEAQVMPTTSIKADGIKNTLNGSITPLHENWRTRPSVLSKNEFVPVQNYALLEAGTNIKNLKIKIDYDIELFYARSDDGVKVEIGFDFKVYHLKNPIDGEYQETIRYGIVSGNFNDIINGAYPYSDVYDLTIPEVRRNDRIVVILEAYNQRPSPVPLILTEKLGMKFQFNKMNVKMEGVSTDYSRRIKAVRLRDAVRYVCESTAGLEINSEILDNELFDQFLFDGNLIRNIEDRPMYLSFNDVLGILKETKIDYQVNESVIFDRDRRYYSNEELLVVSSVRFRDYKKSFNDKFAINLFKYKFKKQQSNKENTETNNYDIICGNINLNLKNKLVELTKVIEIEVVRDSFLIEETRRKSFREVEDSTDEDNTKFLLDSIPFDNTTIEDSFFIKHSVNDSTLLLTNDNTFKWYDLGLSFLDDFIISQDSYNTGYYKVLQITDNVLYLTPVGISPTSYDNPEVTKVTYTPTGFDYKNRTNEGILTNNILSPETYANLNYSVKRNIVKHYSEYLASANIFKKNDPVSVSFYENNKDAETTADEITIVEGQDFTPVNPILNPYLHDVTIILENPNDYFKLEKDVQDKGGFIRIIDAKGNVVRIYPQRMEYNLRERACRIIGEEKFDNKEINITYVNNGFIALNDDITVTKFNYSEKNKKISILDESNKLLFPPTFWQKVAVNEVFAESLTQLKEWMDSIL